ncbi:annexin A1-like [Salarias fasciatus]|uniref:Annexin n=1 Tax=Salarias fasciatus TaxID=181472 RepID=A0A672JLT8_SALFA|nr:annexin A1-like [Salarias fasciatus]XP_029940600.1 annexin A1-like [Salarias fasciatus]
MFKRFLDKLRPDKDEDDTVKVKGKVKPKYYGTVAPYPNFSASNDASVLNNAIKSKGVDEDVIISVLVRRNNEQRQKIKAVYEASTGHKLDTDLKEALRSDLEDVTLALLLAPALFDSYLIRKATKRLGTDEKILVEILVTRTNQEIQEIKRVYKEVYGPDLEHVITDETEGDFRKALLALLSPNRDENTEVDMDLVREDAKTLFEKGESCGDICEETFINILTKRSGPQLRRTLQYYKDNLGDISLPKLMREELRGDIKDCFLALVKCAWNKPAYFAEKLHDAMKGHGTCEDTLIRILVSRSEIDLKKIVEEYRGMYGRPIQEDILHDTKEHFREVLLGLCGPH